VNESVEEVSLVAVTRRSDTEPTDEEDRAFRRVRGSVGATAVWSEEEHAASPRRTADVRPIVMRLTSLER
jgi:hypothetical protein